MMLQTQPASADQLPSLLVASDATSVAVEVRAPATGGRAWAFVGADPADPVCGTAAWAHAGGGVHAWEASTALALARCGFEGPHEVGFGVVAYDAEVRLEGAPDERSVADTLAVRLELPAPAVSATASVVSAGGGDSAASTPASWSMVVTTQEFDAFDRVARVRVASLAPWPYVVEPATGDVAAAGGEFSAQVLSASDPRTCEDNDQFGRACAQDWSLVVTPAASQCTLNGVFTASFRLRCSDLFGGICDAGDNSLVVEIELASDDFCPRLVEVASITRSVRLYNSRAARDEGRAGQSLSGALRSIVFGRVDVGVEAGLDLANTWLRSATIEGGAPDPVRPLVDGVLVSDISVPLSFAYESVSLNEIHLEFVVTSDLLDDDGAGADVVVSVVVAVEYSSLSLVGTEGRAPSTGPLARLRARALDGGGEAPTKVTGIFVSSRKEGSGGAGTLPGGSSEATGSSSAAEDGEELAKAIAMGAGTFAVVTAVVTFFVVRAIVPPRREGELTDEQLAEAKRMYREHLRRSKEGRVDSAPQWPGKPPGWTPPPPPGPVPEWAETATGKKKRRHFDTAPTRASVGGRTPGGGGGGGRARGDSAAVKVLGSAEDLQRVAGMYSLIEATSGALRAARRLRNPPLRDGQRPPPPVGPPPPWVERVALRSLPAIRDDEDDGGGGGGAAAAAALGSTDPRAQGWVAHAVDVAVLDERPVGADEFSVRAIVMEEAYGEECETDEDGPRNVTVPAIVVDTLSAADEAAVLEALREQYEHSQPGGTAGTADTLGTATWSSAHSDYYYHTPESSGHEGGSGGTLYTADTEGGTQDLCFDEDEDDYGYDYGFGTTSTAPPDELDVDYEFENSSMGPADVHALELPGPQLTPLSRMFEAVAEEEEDDDDEEEEDDDDEEEEEY